MSGTSTSSSTNISANSQYSSAPTATYPTNSLAAYSLDSKENVRHAMTAAIYSPIYGAYPTSNISNTAMVSNPITAPFHGIYLSNGTTDDHSIVSHAIKAPAWPSSHSVTDLLSGNINSNFRPTTSTPSQSSSGSPSSSTSSQFTQANLSANSSEMLAAVATAQNHYMQNYYMQAMIAGTNTNTLPSIVAPHTLT